jgi:prolyl oligopeptidase
MQTVVLALHVALGALLVNAAVSSSPPPAAPPATRVEAVVETLHGVKVADPYRWLEKADEGEVKSWTEQQNAYMRGVLDAVPGRKWIEERLWQLHEIGSLGVPAVKGEGSKKRYFYTRRTGKQNQPVLYVRDGLEGADRPLVDVNQLAADGTRALDWWYPSEDGRLVAYGVSANGDEESVLRVRDVRTGKDLPLEITRTRACSVAWRPDGKSFYYTRYPLAGTVPPGEEKYHRQVFLHRLGGDPAQDPKIFGEGRDLKDWPSVVLSPNGRWLGIEVSQGWAKSEIFLVDTKQKGAAAAPVPVVTGKEALYNLADVLDDRLYLVSNEDAPRYRVFAVDVKRPARERWKEIIAQSEDTLESIAIVGGKIAALYLKDASSRVRLFDLGGKPLSEVPLPGLGTASGLSGQHRGGELFYAFASYLTPTQVFRQPLGQGGARGGSSGGSGTGGQAHIWQQLPSPVEASAFEIRQERFTSKDGTSVPMFLVHKRGLQRDGKNPTLLYGYGGFNISLTPAFASALAPFIEQGGVYAVANLRGGAEYGEAWHQAGMLGRKQNVFDDFIAAAEYLVAQKITSRERLAISGRSNGGLLTTAALTQRPDLFRAVISGVPLTDMIRYHRFRIAQLWIPEYGSSEDAQAFQWLYAYSPYHRVKDRVDYPAVLLFTAESDTRVDAMHARKMAARLQAATSGKRPILLRLESQAGHGAGKPLAKVIAQYTDELAFLFRELGMGRNPS